MSLRGPSEALHVIANSSAATIALVAAVANQRVYIYRTIISIGSPSITLTFQDTASSALSQAFQLAANGIIVLDTPINMDPWWFSGAGLGVQLFQSGTTPIGVDLWYLQGP